MMRRTITISILAIAVSAPVAGAQRPNAEKVPTLAGTWTGTVTVPIGDSSIVAPVNYTFTDGPSGIGGSAIVPGQGMGQISAVVRDGKKLKFRVTVQPARSGQPPSLLEHEAEFAADTLITGIVNLDGKPVAKIRITPQAKRDPSPRPADLSAGAGRPRSTRGSTR